MLTPGEYREFILLFRHGYYVRRDLWLREEHNLISFLVSIQTEGNGEHLSLPKWKQPEILKIDKEGMSPLSRKEGPSCPYMLQSSKVPQSLQLL